MSDLLRDQSIKVTSKELLIPILHALADDFEKNKAEWQSTNIKDFLASMASWLEDCDGYYDNRGVAVPTNGWQVIADAVRAAKHYE